MITDESKPFILYIMRKTSLVSSGVVHIRFDEMIHDRRSEKYTF